jgi:hypothetical protein
MSPLDATGSTSANIGFCGVAVYDARPQRYCRCHQQLRQLQSDEGVATAFRPVACDLDFRENFKYETAFRAAQNILTGKMEALGNPRTWTTA